MYAIQPSDASQHNRLSRTKQHDLIRNLADSIETIWSSQLNLIPYTVPKELGYIEGQLDGDTLTISNRCYRTNRFRKLHLELARIGTKLDVLHCVMFPKPQYALPIFGADIVAGPKGVSAAIVDLSPVTADCTLSLDYSSALSSLKPAQFSDWRQLPEWGDIFSRFCLFVRPINEGEELAFLNLVCDYLMVHCRLSSTAEPVSSMQQDEIIIGQKNYCFKQSQNDKTRRVLEKSFGTEWTARYIREMLFDVD